MIHCTVLGKVSEGTGETIKDQGGDSYANSHTPTQAVQVIELDSYHQIPSLQWCSSSRNPELCRGKETKVPDTLSGKENCLPQNLVIEFASITANFSTLNSAKQQHFKEHSDRGDSGLQ